MRQLSEEVACLKANREEERLEWKKKTAKSEEEIATRKVSMHICKYCPLINNVHCIILPYLFVQSINRRETRRSGL